MIISIVLNFFRPILTIVVKTLFNPNANWRHLKWNSKIWMNLFEWLGTQNIPAGYPKCSNILPASLLLCASSTMDGTGSCLLLEPANVWGCAGGGVVITDDHPTEQGKCCLKTGYIFACLFSHSRQANDVIW